MKDLPVPVLLAGGRPEPWRERPPDRRFAADADGRLHAVRRLHRVKYEHDRSEWRKEIDRENRLLRPVEVAPTPPPTPEPPPKPAAMRAAPSTQRWIRRQARVWAPWGDQTEQTAFAIAAKRRNGESIFRMSDEYGVPVLTILEAVRRVRRLEQERKVAENREPSV